ncbi:hypothetical protein GLOIN_2v1842826 [Rhizophagus irregularis DAOM 181602=DAOM 197198]|nr:hypothetical protein GLOIN_2v1842826 [Rhizophagus irregularis DAOM 181602=DAOM 197198]
MLLAQKNAGPHPGVIKLFSSLTDLNYKPGHNNHVYFQNLSISKDDVALLDTYDPEEILNKYIVRVAGKGFTVVDHPSEVYGFPDAHECIDGNLPLRLVLDIDARQKPDPMNPKFPSLDESKISREDLLSKILIACVDIINTDLNFAILDAFTLASSSNANKCSWHIVYKYARFIDYRDLKGFVEKVADKVGKPYSKFIDIGLYKYRFSLRLLGSAKEDRVKRPAISSVKKGYHKLEDYLVQPKWNASEIWPQTFSPEKEEKKFQPIEDETALSNGASLKMTTLIRSPLGTWKTTTLREIIMALKNKIHDLSSLPCYIWVSYQKSLSNESKTKLDELKASGFRICNYQNIQGDLSINEWDIIIVQVESLFRIEFTARPFVAILDEANAIMRQMFSGTNARESENAIRDVLRSARHVLAMDAFANKSTLTFLQTYRGENICIVDNKYQPRIGETVEFIYDPNSGAEAMRIGYDLLRQGKRVAFVSTGAVMARALVEKASKLFKPDNSPVKARAYYGNMDGKQRQKDFSNIDVAWGELDCVAYTNTVEAGISFEVTGHFDIVIAITNITTPVHVEALAQMLYRIRDCPCRIVSVFYQKNSNELFRPPGRENIRAELESARPNNLPTSIKGHCEWDSNAVSYKIDESPAVITFVEVEHQKRLSARYFIEKLCSLIASTGASLQLIKMDESRGVIGNRKKVRNEVRVEALVIKETDFDAVATSRNLDPEEAENLKFDQERSIPDTMALKRFYMRNIYGKDIDNEIWDNLCNKKFVKHFSPPEPRKHFLWLSHFRKQGYDEESAMKGLEVKDIAQWEDSHYKAGYNSEKSIAEDLHKSYSANHWKVIRELFQILGFTGIDDKRILSSNIISETFTQSCERFIKVLDQSLLLFGFKSRAKVTSDLNSAIRAINAIAGNWCGYTVKINRKKIGPKEKQVWERSYQINRQPYDGLGFGDKGTPELPPYRPKTDNDIQELFDSIGQDK